MEGLGWRRATMRVPLRAVWQLRHYDLRNKRLPRTSPIPLERPRFHVKIEPAGY